jgi:hypothetical protein
MSKYFKLLFIVLCIGTVNSTITKAQASSPNEKNKMPCLEGICVGDDIQSLKNINWLSVDKELRSPQQIDGWKVIGDTKAFQSLLPYLSTRIIDKKGIKLLPQIKGFCKRPYNNPIFSTFYTAKDGKFMEIKFGLVTLSNYKSQKIVVSEIRKVVSNKEISSSQIDSLRSEAKKRYPSSNQTLSQTYTDVQHHMENGKIDSVNLRLHYKDGLLGSGKDESLLEFPGCTQKVKL